MLGPNARGLLANPAHSIYVTVVSFWEITVKWRVGKHPLSGSIYAEFVEQQGLNLITVTGEHIMSLESLAMHHKDPFDHLILAQAKVEKAAIITSDREMTLYGVQCFPAGK